MSKNRRSQKLALFLGFLLTLMLFTVAACQKHEHLFYSYWSYNETHHWKAAACEHLDEKSEYGEHEFVEDVCKICGYQLPAKKPVEPTPPAENPSDKFVFHELYSDTGSVNGYSISVGEMKNETQIAIPRTYKGLPVLEIEDYGFADCENLTVVAIPDGVQKIGDDAFHGCGAMTLCEVPDSVKEMGDSVFEGCRSLKDVRLSPNAIQIQSRTFALCEALEKIEFPEGVSELDDEVFTGCGALSDVTLPKSLREIGEKVFYQCKSLRRIELPDGLLKIDDQAFYLCNHLEEIRIPDSVKELGDQIFYQCMLLKSVRLGENCTEIKMGEFAGCVSLLTVEIPKSCTFIGEDAFEGCEELEEIFFGGTFEEWDAIRKESGWDRDCGAYAVRCQE